MYIKLKVSNIIKRSMDISKIDINHVTSISEQNFRLQACDAQLHSSENCKQAELLIHSGTDT